MNRTVKLLVPILMVIMSGVLAAGENMKKAADFTLTDYNGKAYTLFADKDSKAIVIMFISTRCPVSNAYNGRMSALYNDYISRGVSIIAINANKQETTEDIKEHAVEHKFPFRVLKDTDNKVADDYDAQVTPEIFVINQEHQILYHGRIDNSQREDKVESKDLRNALDEILADKPVSVPETKAFGCTIKRVN